MKPSSRSQSTSPPKTVEEITVLQGFHSPSRETGYTHVEAIKGKGSRSKFTPDHTRRAVEIIRTTKHHPKWRLRRLEE